MQNSLLILQPNEYFSEIRYNSSETMNILVPTKKNKQ